jgi:hypothetical protein
MLPATNSLGNIDGRLSSINQPREVALFSGGGINQRGSEVSYQPNSYMN